MVRKSVLCVGMLVVISQVSAMRADAVEIADGLVAHYSLDGLAGAVSDSTGSYDGVNTGNTTRGVTGVDLRFGTAFSFDGVDDFVDLPGGILPGSADFSISLWVRLESFSAPESPWNYFIDLREDVNHVAAEFDEWLWVSSDTNAVPHYPLTLNQWRHVAYTYSQSEGFTEIYLDGIYVSRQTGAITAFNAPDRTNRIAANSLNSGSDFLHGQLDEVGIWNRVLTTSELSNLALNPIPEPSTALLLATGLLGLAARRRTLRRGDGRELC